MGIGATTCQPLTYCTIISLRVSWWQRLYYITESEEQAMSDDVPDEGPDEGPDEDKALEGEDIIVS